MHYIVRMFEPPADESLTLPRPRVVVLGASTRAGVFSVLRAGFEPYAIDQFADADLKYVTSVESVDSLSMTPDSTDSPALSALQKYAGIPILYAGGMENQPQLLDQLEQKHSIWAADRAAIEKVRQPKQLADGLTNVRQRVLPVQAGNDPPPRDGTWLIKPIASAGGQGISVWDESTPHDKLDEKHYFQKRVVGNVYSALFIAEKAPGDVRFVGLTRQLVGCPELHAGPFAWCGNIGPAFLPVEAEFLIRRWGNILKWKFGLSGLYGIDFIVDEAGAPWLIEVNPRMTGSVEILELACGMQLLADHVACYDSSAASFAREFAAPPPPPQDERLGRAILYAPYRLKSNIPLTQPIVWNTAPPIADIPEPGKVIEAGRPVCSVYAWGTNIDDVTDKLFAAAREVEQHLERVDEA